MLVETDGTNGEPWAGSRTYGESPRDSAPLHLDVRDAFHAYEIVAMAMLHIMSQRMPEPLVRRKQRQSICS